MNIRYLKEENDMSENDKKIVTGWVLVTIGGVLVASGFGTIAGVGAGLIALGVWAGFIGAVKLS